MISAALRNRRRIYVDRAVKNLLQFFSFSFETCNYSYSSLWSRRKHKATSGRESYDVYYRDIL